MNLRPAERPGFGKPGSVDPGAIPRMAPHLQREAVLLLMEMGKNALTIAQCSGLGPMEVMHIRDRRLDPFRLEQPDFSEVL